MNPNTSRDVVVDDSYWSDLEYCKNTKVWLINYTQYIINQYTL
jgi:hypothetical protein